jgi:hypothetical protein
MQSQPCGCQGIPQIHALNQGQGTVKPCSEYLQVVFLTTVADGRRFMFTVAWILSGALLALDTERDNDPVTAAVRAFRKSTL